MSDTYTDTYTDTDTYDEYDGDTATAVETPVAAQDVAALITKGLADLEVLKAQVAEAEDRVAAARAEADSVIAAAKEQAQQTIAAARAAATEAIEKVKAEQDAIVAQVREDANAEVDATKAEQQEALAAVSAEVETAQEAYAKLINDLIDTGWATTGSLASLGHQVPRRGGRKKK